MVTRDARVTTAQPAPWVWSALTDVDNLDRWSGLDVCVDGNDRRLRAGSTWDCRMVLDGRPFAATLSVIDLRPLVSLALRSETSVLTAVERFTLSTVAGGGMVGYHLTAHSRVASSTLTGWADEHSARVVEGLTRLLHAP